MGIIRPIMLSRPPPFVATQSILKQNLKEYKLLTNLKEYTLLTKITCKQFLVFFVGGIETAVY